MNIERKKTVAAFGEILWDILPEETVLGGAPLNFVYRMNSLGDKGIMISRLGSDDMGDRAFDLLELLGLSTRYIQRDSAFPTGTAPVTFDGSGNPQFVITPDTAYDNIEMTDDIKEIAARADCVCFGTLVQRSDVSRSVLHNFLDISKDALVFCDINLRKDCYNRDTVYMSLNRADVLKLNDDEAVILSGMFEREYTDVQSFCSDIVLRFGLSYCVVTFGDKGAYGHSSKGERVYVPGYRINLRDAVGAGDAFSAGFLHCILHGGSLINACDAGNILGALVASKRGGTSVVTQKEIDRFPLKDFDRLFHPEFINLA